MTAVALAYDASLDAYGFGSSHPLRPERVALSVALMGAYGLASPSHLEPIAIGPAGREDLCHQLRLRGGERCLQHQGHRQNR